MLKIATTCSLTCTTLLLPGIGTVHDLRAAYDAETVAILKPFGPDLILTAGYLYLLTEPMLAAFRNRILNLHFADLTLRTPDGEPGFPGIHAVRVESGEIILEIP